MYIDRLGSEERNSQEDFWGHYLCPSGYYGAIEIADLTKSRKIKKKREDVLLLHAQPDASALKSGICPEDHQVGLWSTLSIPEIRSHSIGIQVFNT